LLIDELSWKSQIPLNQLASHLLNLEFRGYIKALPGKKFRYME
jgi:DNA processing protein